MRLVAITPSSPEWDVLHTAGGGDFLGEKDGSKLWAICNPKPIGVVGFAPHKAEGMAEAQIWVKPEFRKIWWTRNFYQMWLALAFMPGVNTIVTDVGDNTASERMISRLGWQKYGHSGEVSYYSLTKEDAMRG